MKMSLPRIALAVTAFALLVPAGAGATTRAIRPAAAAGHAAPSSLTAHVGWRKTVKPDIKCKFEFCGELYASSSQDYLEYEWCVGYGSDPCDDLYTGSVVWYAQAYKAKNFKPEAGIYNYLETSGSAASGDQGVIGNPVYQYVLDDGAKVTNGKYKYVDYTDVYWGSSNSGYIIIGLGVYE